MIEALFNKINSLVLLKISILSIILSNSDIENISDRIISEYQPICKNVCIDLNSNQNKKSYIGLNWMISHNMILSGKTTVNLNSNNYLDIISHNIVGGKLILRQAENSKLIFSMSANKLRYTDNGNYTWIQNSFIFLKKIKKYSAQLVLDQIRINNSNIRKINFIGSYNILKDIFLYIGVSQAINSEDKSLTSFLSLGFNL